MVSVQSNPNYNQEKSRCEYLHNKLAHIKKLISEYDQQQLRAGDSGAPTELFRSRDQRSLAAKMDVGAADLEIHTSARPSGKKQP